jgi:malonyl CoA-acyl carrier protein transacylase
MRLVLTALLRSHLADLTADADAPAVDVPAGPMASVRGVPAQVLRGWIAQDVALHGGGVELGLVNSERFAVLCGEPARLLAFLRRSEHELRRHRAQWAFLPTTAPFHCSLLAGAAASVLAARDHLGEPLDGARLALPVLAGDREQDLRGCRDLAAEFVRQTMVRPLDWRATVLRAVRVHRPEQVIDFGPGASARAFAKDSLRGSGPRLPFRTAARLASAAAVGYPEGYPAGLERVAG